MASKDLLERLQQRLALLGAWRPQRHPSASPTANPTEFKAQKPEALALRQVRRSYNIGNNLQDRWDDSS
jgi:hypothetical protein